MSEAWRDVFGSREKTIRVGIERFDRDQGSRIGGKAPRGVASPVCPVTGEEMDYLLTLERDLVPILPEGKAISVFVTKDPDAISRSMAVFVARYPAVEETLQAVLHDVSPRDGDAGRSRVGGRALGVEGVVDDQEALEEGEDDTEEGEDAPPVLSSKIGGRPGCLQSSGDRATSVLERNGFQFLFQFSEHYPERDIEPSTFLFGGGTMLVFFRSARRESFEAVDFEDLVAVWEV